MPGGDSSRHSSSLPDTFTRGPCATSCACICGPVTSGILWETALIMAVAGEWNLDQTSQHNSNRTTEPEKGQRSRKGQPNKRTAINEKGKGQPQHSAALSFLNLDHQNLIKRYNAIVIGQWTTPA
ncbi:hypothetical protein BaRGS_00006833, partial [Batillaria attramentaria]